MLKESVKRKNHQFIGAVGLKTPGSVAQFLNMSEIKKLRFPRENGVIVPS